MDHKLTPAQFAKESGLTLSYVYALVWSGRLPAEKADGVWQISAAELERRKAVAQ